MLIFNSLIIYLVGYILSIIGKYICKFSGLYWQWDSRSSRKLAGKEREINKPAGFRIAIKAILCLSKYSWSLFTVEKQMSHFGKLCWHSVLIWVSLCRLLSIVRNFKFLYETLLILEIRITTVSLNETKINLSRSR